MKKKSKQGRHAGNSMKGLAADATAALINSDIADLDPAAAGFVRDLFTFAKMQHTDPDAVDAHLKRVSLEDSGSASDPAFAQHRFLLRNLVRYLRKAVGNDDPSVAFQEVVRALKAGAHAGPVRPTIPATIFAAAEVYHEKGYVDTRAVEEALIDRGAVTGKFDAGAGRVRHRGTGKLLKQLGFKTKTPKNG